MYVAPDDQFEITQKRYRGFNPAFVRQVWEKRRARRKRSPYVPGQIWTPEKKERIEDMLRRGLSSNQIGQVFGVSGDGIRGVVRHDPKLRAIGFARGQAK